MTVAAARIPCGPGVGPTRLPPCWFEIDPPHLHNASMPRIPMLTGWLPPDRGAVGQYSLGFAKGQAAQEHDATLVGLSSASASVERTTRGSGRLTVRRIRRPAEDGGNLAARAWRMLRSNLSLLRAGRSELRPADEPRFTAAPAAMLRFSMPFAKSMRVRTCYRITDFHPECLIAAPGHAPPCLWPIAAITRIRRRRVDAGDAENVARAPSELVPDGGTARNDAGGVALAGGAAR